MGIDLNTIEEEEKEANHPTYSDAAAATAPEDVLESASVCLELWHACAGPRIWLPKKESLVVYLPQGHLEHLGIGVSDGGRGRTALCSFDVRPHVFCRVVDVKLHADVATDEVYTQLSLVAENEDFEGRLNKGELQGNAEEDDIDSVIMSTIPHMFCKTLTASDTSTHGGFSVPRRAAEDCFPPLDYKQQRPSQELIAKDLHGMEWRFRHIYRGQPRRHLLTTGWSAFVNKKKLSSGDAVLFLRGNDGVLRLGVRRAAPFKFSGPISEHQNLDLNLTTFTAVVNSVSMKSVFHVNYNPRASSSDFIVPYWKFVKSLTHSISVGMRFKILFESDDASERRPAGLITGVSEIDLLRWPGSKWRCLMVNWDEVVDANRENRISPWNIEPTGSVLGSDALVTRGSKRAKISLPSVNFDFPILNGNSCLDLRVSASYHKVLQGQEFTRLITPNSIGVTASHVTEAGNHQCLEGFSESVRFQGVLQGQEVASNDPSFLGARSGALARNDGHRLFDYIHSSYAGSRLPASSMSFVTLIQPSLPSIQVSSPSSVLMFQEASSKSSPTQSMYGMNNQESNDGSCYFAHLNGSEAFHRNEANYPFWLPTADHHFANQQHKMVKIHALVMDSNLHTEKEPRVSPNGCKLFGFSLTERIPEANLVDKYLPISPTSTEASVEPAFSSSSIPPVPAEPVSCSCSGVTDRYALCAAPI